LVSALLLPLPQAASDSSVAAATPAAIARVVIFLQFYAETSLYSFF